jgi:hypothetical protein
VPNRLVYKEQFDIKYRYNNFEDCINKVSLVFNNELKIPDLQFNNNNNIFKKWFN